MTEFLKALLPIKPSTLKHSFKSPSFITTAGIPEIKELFSFKLFKSTTTKESFLLFISEILCFDRIGAFISW